MSAPVYCSAIVDELGDNRWRVTVEGCKPHDQTRTYDVEAETDEDAAFKGMDLFIDEMTALAEQ